MRLFFKCALILFLTGVLIFLSASLVAYQILTHQVREEALEKAGVILEAGQALRSFSSTNANELLQLQIQQHLPPDISQLLPVFDAMKTLQAHLSNYSYKEAVLNPINPKNQAIEWESEVVQEFRNRPNRKEISAERESPTGKTLYVSRPIQITDTKCLACHSMSEPSSQALQAKYGPLRGPGWKMGETVGAQIVTVSLETLKNQLDDLFLRFTTQLFVLLVMVFLVLQFILTVFILRPIAKLSEIAVRVSLGDETAPEFIIGSNDEIGALARAFARMHASLNKAIAMIRAD